MWNNFLAIIHVSCKLKSQTAKERGEKYSPIVPLECMNFFATKYKHKFHLRGKCDFQLNTLLMCYSFNKKSFFLLIHRNQLQTWKKFTCHLKTILLQFFIVGYNMLQKRRSFMWWFSDNVIYHFVEDPCVHLVIYYGEEISHWLVIFCQIRGKGLLYIKILCNKLQVQQFSNIFIK